jgi:hypothetical protein
VQIPYRLLFFTAQFRNGTAIVDSGTTISLIAVGVTILGLFGGWMFRIDRLSTKTSEKLDGIGTSLAKNDRDHDLMWNAHHQDVKGLVEVSNRLTRLETMMELSGIGTHAKRHVAPDDGEDAT